ncbi:MAG: hypothetical protein H6Q73_131 [Firmicutes bacterium]|nr:hypothetical protein [Bacillota bacterium]
MASIKPFRGLRPTPELASKIASLPYDVMDSEEARALTENNPYSFLRVTKSEVDLAPEVDPHSPSVYEKARDNLAAFRLQGFLEQDAEPHFYIYRQEMGSHVQVGLVAAASVDEYENNLIKKHELTRPDKEQDRVDHIRTTGAQTGAVFLTYKANKTVESIIRRCMEKSAVYDFSGVDGVRHTLYVVDSVADESAIEEAFAAIPVMYIADGHHRSAAAKRVRDICRNANQNHTGDEEYNRFLAVIFPHNMMKIMDYNRVVADLNGLTADSFVSIVREKFVVEEARGGAVKPNQARQFGMYLDGKWYKLVARPELYSENDLVENLDVSVLQNHLLAPVLGISDPRTDKRINFVGGIRGMRELERLVDSGKYVVAFSMFPTSIEELMAIADNGQIMPPKSTWFEPKLRDAMVVHII